MPRRGSNSRVQVCTDLQALWRHQRGDAPPVVNATGITATDWMMLNDSPGGLAIMHVSGNTHGIVAGAALAVQPAADQPWGLCVVRWARSDNPEHLELGLELLAPAAEAVRLVRHGGGESLSDDAAIEAFRLPPLAATQRGEALLAAPGIHQAGTFTLVSENSARIQLTDCTPGALLLQTSSVELFEFTRDFSPAGL
jgi:cyclic-di-GMP-binding protein